MIGAVLNCFAIPYELAFDPPWFKTFGFIILNYFIDIIFFLDIVVNFRTVI